MPACIRPLPQSGACKKSSPRVFFEAPAATMNLSRDRSALAFHKLSRQISKLSEKPKPECVHRFRTLSRRVEALLEGLIAHPTGNDKKLLVLLARLRKKAGKVRDLDVQISTLRALRMPQDRARKTEAWRRDCTKIGYSVWGRHWVFGRSLRSTGCSGRP